MKGNMLHGRAILEEEVFHSDMGLRTRTRRCVTVFLWIGKDVLHHGLEAVPGRIGGDKQHIRGVDDPCHIRELIDLGG